MNIAIYDTEHFETTYALVRTLDTPQNELYIFTTSNMESVLKQMLGEKTNKYHWVIQKKTSLRFAFHLFSCCKRKAISYLFLNTVSYHHIYFGIICFFLKKTKSVLTIHDTNNFFRPKVNASFRQIMHFFGKKVLIRNASMYATLLESTRQYIHKVYKIKKPIIVLPGAVYEEGKKTAVYSAKTLSLVVCGSIDPYRREYEQLFELAQELENRQVISRIVLLGTAVRDYGEKIIRKCATTQMQFVQFIVYNNFVDPLEYGAQLQQCNFIFQPLKKILQKPREQPEEYGISTCSGAFFDAVRFARPILLPEYINISHELKGHCIPYHSLHELSDYLKNITFTQKNELINLARLNSETFEIKKVREKLFELLN
jgi:hypothetical protein